MRGTEPVEPFTEHTGTAVAVRRDDIDTDQILPAEFCKRVVKSGYADALFKRWREWGDCVIDRPEHRGATILLAGKDFGIGSSREHAVWALRDGGFLAVVATGFGDIFRRNALNNGLIPVDLPAPVVEGLMDRVEADPGFRITVDLRACRLRWADGRADFVVDDRARRMLLEGKDAIEQTLLRQDAIAAYEARRAPWMPAVPRGAFDAASATVAR